jgi:hypothetical protein
MPSTHPRLLAVAIIVLLASTIAGMPAAATSTPQPANADTAIPPSGPPDGMNNSTFQRLWSGDTDTGSVTNTTTDQERTSESAFMGRLADATDIPFSQPPDAAGAWNRDNFPTYTPGDADTSVHPAGASLADGVYIKDAFASIYAVQPSTRLHRDAGTTQYISPSGTVRAVSDYRVVVPPPDQDGPIRSQHALSNHRVDRVVLRADGHQLDTGRGHQATLSYSTLNGSVTLTVAATITADVQTVTRECSQWNETTAACTGSWTETSDTRRVSKTVSTATDATVASTDAYDGVNVAFSTRNESAGAVVHTPTPWTSLSVGESTRAHSNWWFYTATTPTWQPLEASTATDTSRTQSQARPLQVHAYPSRGAAYIPSETATDQPSLEIAATWGETRSGPQLPPAIDIEPAATYTNTGSIAVTADTPDKTSFESVTVSGIVAGQSTTLSMDDQRTVRDTSLALNVRERNATHVVVTAEVTGTTQGQPVSTGSVTISGQRVPLNETGQGVATIADPPLLVHATYNPRAWWRTQQPYSHASATAKASPTMPSMQRFIDLGVVTVLWFLPVVLLVGGFEYVTGGDLFGLIPRNS